MEMMGSQMIKDNFNPFLHFLNVSIFVISVIRNMRITLKIFRQYLVRGDFLLIILCAPVVSDGRKHVWSWTTNTGHSLLLLMRGSWKFCSGCTSFGKKASPKNPLKKDKPYEKWAAYTLFPSTLCLYLENYNLFHKRQISITDFIFKIPF